MQSVRAHIRPDQAAGMERTRDSDVVREKPVVVNEAVPAPERSPGQTLWLHWLMKVKVVEEPPLMRNRIKKRKEEILAKLIILSREVTGGVMIVYVRVV